MKSYCRYCWIYLLIIVLAGCESVESGWNEVESWFDSDSQEASPSSATPSSGGIQPAFGQSAAFKNQPSNTKPVPLMQDSPASADLRTLQQNLLSYAGDRVFFDKNSVALKPRAHAVLVRMADWLRDHPNQGITLIGHAYEQSSDNANFLLGQKRADAVKDYLIAIGVNNARLEAVSLGDRRPYAQGDDRSAQALNRRVEAVVASW